MSTSDEDDLEQAKKELAALPKDEFFKRAAVLLDLAKKSRERRAKSRRDAEKAMDRLFNPEPPPEP